jgi:hypothetical protein
VSWDKKKKKNPKNKRGEYIIERSCIEINSTEIQFSIIFGKQKRKTKEKSVETNQIKWEKTIQEEYS